MRNYKKDFPILMESENQTKLVYLDNAATTQKPTYVTDAILDYYNGYNANPHRGSYSISVKATEAMENVRSKVKSFLKIEDKTGEIIFTKNATEALNLVSQSYGRSFVEKGDEILISIQEHHSNLVTWQQVAKEKGATLKYIYLNEDGTIDMKDFLNKISEKTKVVAITQVSNVLGFINPIEEVLKISKEYGAITVVDGTQAVPHMSVDLSKLDPDFYVFSGHKLLAPMGVGVLYGRREHLNKMPPFLYGGDMIEYVEEQSTEFAAIPSKFEAGTQNVEAIIGLGAAIDYLEKIGMEEVRSHEQKLTTYAIKQLQKLPYIKIVGSENEKRIGVIPFEVLDVHPHDVASILDQDGICIRAGSHCAQPLLNHMGYRAVCRASFYIYNTTEEIDYFVEKLQEVRRCLGYES
ncbi:cysteine desulfurase [Metaclostridioides mangenotii]|uniref:cysteine desulfurase n=1 Tax=Metaclostridioides mangenotii TaxID=1540 RepID=UPI0028ECF781|nr:cysteine desulfurase [Clostridioides mangenotii]